MLRAHNLQISGPGLFSVCLRSLKPKILRLVSVDLQTANGRETLFWSISKWGKDFPERIKSFTLDCQCKTKVNEQKIDEALWKKVRKLFNGINEGHPEGIDLAEKTTDIDTVRSDTSEKKCQCKSVEIEQRIEEVTIGESWKRVTRSGMIMGYQKLPEYS